MFVVETLSSGRNRRERREQKGRIKRRRPAKEESICIYDWETKRKKRDDRLLSIPSLSIAFLFVCNPCVISSRSLLLRIGFIKLMPFAVQFNAFPFSPIHLSTAFDIPTNITNNKTDYTVTFCLQWISSLLFSPGLLPVGTLFPVAHAGVSFASNRYARTNCTSCELSLEDLFIYFLICRFAMTDEQSSEKKRRNKKNKRKSW